MADIAIGWDLFHFEYISFTRFGSRSLIYFLAWICFTLSTPAILDSAPDDWCSSLVGFVLLWVHQRYWIWFPMADAVPCPDLLYFEYISLTRFGYQSLSYFLGFIFFSLSKPAILDSAPEGWCSSLVSFVSLSVHQLYQIRLPIANVFPDLDMFYFEYTSNIGFGFRWLM